MHQGEHAHCVVKRFYRISNKRRAYKQIASKVARQRYLQAKQAAHSHLAPQTRAETSDFEPHIRASDHYHMSHDRRHRLTLSQFEQDREDDPAATVSQTKHSVHFSSPLISRQDFTSKLQNHLLGRLLQRDFDSDDHEDFTDADRNCIEIFRGTLED